MPVVTQLSISGLVPLQFKFFLFYNVKCVHIILLHTACGVICWSSAFVYLFCSRPLLTRNFSLCWQRRWRNCWNWWVLLSCLSVVLRHFWNLYAWTEKDFAYKKIKCLYFWSLHYRFVNFFMLCNLLFNLFPESQKKFEKRKFFFGLLWTCILVSLWLMGLCVCMRVCLGPFIVAELSGLSVVYHVYTWLRHWM